jgi:hypothetical protein
MSRASERLTARHRATIRQATEDRCPFLTPAEVLSLLDDADELDAVKAELAAEERLREEWVAWADDAAHVLLAALGRDARGMVGGEAGQDVARYAREAAAELDRRRRTGDGPVEHVRE